MLYLKDDCREKVVTYKERAEKIAVAGGVCVHSSRYIDRKEGSLGPQRETGDRRTPKPPRFFLHFWAVPLICRSLYLYLHSSVNVVLRDTWQVERHRAEFQSAALRIYTRVSTLKTTAVGVCCQNARPWAQKNRTSGREN